MGMCGEAAQTLHKTVPASLLAGAVIVQYSVSDRRSLTHLTVTTPRSDYRTSDGVALTANAFDEDIQRSLQAGLNAHLSKPVEPGILYETLEKLVCLKTL